jgi:hypothetical protein
MPRRKKTQPAQAPGLEAGAAYGEAGANLAAQDPAQGGIPLPAGGGPVTAPPPQPQQRPLPVEAARGFNPQITPLTAPGEGRNIPTTLPRITSEQRSADLLRNWAAATGDPLMAQSAQQLGQL